MAQSSEDRRQTLAALVTGRSDDEITAGVERRGTESVLDQVFAGMVEACLKAGDQRAVIQYDVGVAGKTHSYQLKIDGGRCEMSKGAPAPARTTLIADVPDFLRIISGKQNGVMALMTGKLKLKGDMMFARTMQGWFRQG